MILEVGPNRSLAHYRPNSKPSADAENKYAIVNQGGRWQTDKREYLRPKDEKMAQFLLSFSPRFALASSLTRKTLPITWQLSRKVLSALFHKHELSDACNWLVSTVTGNFLQNCDPFYLKSQPILLSWTTRQWWRKHHQDSDLWSPDDKADGFLLHQSGTRFWEGASFREL